MTQEKPEIDFPDGPPPTDLEVTDLTAGDGPEAAAGQTVLVARGSAARLMAETRQAATDLAVVAIVDEITVSGTPARGAQPSPATPRNRKKTGGA